MKIKNIVSGRIFDAETIIDGGYPSEDGQRALMALNKRILELTMGEAVQLACNRQWMLAIDEHTVLHVARR